jgi:hypothetical protein
MLADDEDPAEPDSDTEQKGVDVDEDEDEDEDEEPTPPHRQPPNRLFPALHAEIAAAITSLGGAVAPKLNWSAPKDAAFISRHPNTMKCTSPNDVYLLLKSSNFIVHDLDHAFDGTVPSSPDSTSQPPASEPAASSSSSPSPLPYRPVLVLRAYFDPLPSLEFRCFVRRRRLVAVSQREAGVHYAFLASSPATRKQVVSRTRELFRRLRMRRTFPDADFVFDVYIPEAAGYNSSDDDDGDGERREKATKLGRARLIDINPWAPRTDTLLFGWGELLAMGPPPLLGTVSSPAEQEGLSSSTDDEEEEDEPDPELRLVEKDDPAAFNFGSSPFAAHKLPKEVVDASQLGEESLREFARQWQKIMEEGQEESGSDGDEERKGQDNEFPGNEST